LLCAASCSNNVNNGESKYFLQQPKPQKMLQETKTRFEFFFCTS
jgi:hypothetical protein